MYWLTCQLLLRWIESRGNLTFHVNKLPPIFPMPYDKIPPKTPANVLCHSAVLRGCPSLRYHITLMSITLGSVAASSMPNTTVLQPDQRSCDKALASKGMLPIAWDKYRRICRLEIVWWARESEIPWQDTWDRRCFRANCILDSSNWHLLWYLRWQRSPKQSERWLDQWRRQKRSAE